MSERVHRSIMNIKVGMFFYILSLFLALFSRRVFLDCLGTEFIGLTGMLNNILNFLSVAELGIGTSIVYFLYKPLQENNHRKINEVMSMLSFLYRCIGLIIGILGVLISVFFPWWFNDLHTSLILVYFAFYSFLCSCMIGYIFNYRQLLLAANQRQYVVRAFTQSIRIIQCIAQILLAYYFRNVYLWITVELVFSIIGCIVLNYRIDKSYPWLSINLREGRRNLIRYPEVLKKTKQIFFFRIKDFLLYRSDEILVGAFVSVTQVAFYGNYLIVINKLNLLVNILGDGLSAGVGNLLAEGNEKNIMKIFWEMTATRFLVLGMVIFPLIMFIQPLITCWVGKEYQLSNLIAYLLIINLFLRLQYTTIQLFVEASGLYGDVWTSWVEFTINVVVTLSLAPFFGIVGILLGKIISVFFFNVFWKPYYLFSKGFKRSVWIYWRPMITYYALFFIFAACAIFTKIFIIDVYVFSWGALIVYGIITIPIIMLFYFLSLFIFTHGMKYLVVRKPFIYNRLKNFLMFSN